MAKRKLIAFMTNEVEGDYHELLLKGVNEAAIKHNVNLVVVVGKALNSQVKYECNHNITYDFINNHNVDGIVMSSGTMSKFVDHDQFLELYNRFTIPTVSISIPVGKYCYANNKTGFKKAIKHLIDVHKKRSIVFIAGPETHIEAVERYNTYLDVLKENNIEFNPVMIIRGDFTYYSALDGVKDFLAKGIFFDSIVSSNDEMATGAIKVLKERHYRVPEDISIVGFDNVATSLIDSITTVSQPVYEMGYSALEMVVNIIDGREVEPKILDTELVIRESCGCFMNTLTNEWEFSQKSIEMKKMIDEFVSDMYGDIRKIMDVCEFQEFINKILCYLKSQEDEKYNYVLELFKNKISILREDECFLLHKLLLELKEMITSVGLDPKIVECCFSDLATVLIDELHKKSVARNRHVLGSLQNLRYILLALFTKLNVVKNYKESFFERIDIINIDSLYVYTYDNSFIYQKLEYNLFDKPKNLNLLISNKALKNNSMQSDEIISCVIDDKRKTHIMFPVFFHDEQLGIAFYDYPDFWNENSIYETLSVELSCAIKISLMLNSHKKVENELKFALKEFEKYNDNLKYLSFRDELTGLYNRRGFIKHGTILLEKASEKSGKGILIFADMDGLKKINDKYGHGEGDNAIKEIASIITQAFSRDDIIARLGGDEFTILTTVDSDYEEGLIIDKIKSLTDYHNEKSLKPYMLSISMGVVVFTLKENNQTLDSLLKKADITLYKNKHSK